MSNVSVDPIALQCVKIGLIESLHVRIDKTGSKVSMVPGRSLLGGSSPFQSFKKYDLSLALEYIKDNDLYIPQPTPPASPLVVKREVPAKEVINVPGDATDAERLVRRFDLNSIDRNGVKNILPRDSLTRWEFNRPFPLFVARLILVSRAIGEAKAVSRITTDLSLRNDGCTSLREWWATASSHQRWTLLTTRKVSGEAKSGLPDNMNLLLSVECPFSDSHIEVEALSDEGEESSYGGVSFASC
jgi:hypothetical protein